MNRHQTAALLTLAGAAAALAIVAKASFLASLHPLAAARRYPNREERIARAWRQHRHLIYRSCQDQVPLGI